jgi:ribosome-associated protein
MIEITATISLQDSEIQLNFIRAPGPGGQNVNKLATAVQLRFDALHSPSLPEDVRLRLLTFAGKKLTLQGEIILKASRYRTQERNKQDALDRLREIIKRAANLPKKRKKTKPSVTVVKKRLAKKKLHARNKALRRSKLGGED